jgi:hypothetical protein
MLPRTPRSRALRRPARVAPLALAAALLGACAGPPAAERAGDDRGRVDPAALLATLTPGDPAARRGHGAFEPLDGLDTDRWVGVLGGAPYQIEVPRRWNGMLVLYARGERDPAAAPTVQPPPLREHLVRQGYAWAATGYGAGGYDAGAALEDVNALALAFARIAADNGRRLDAPARRVIVGQAMGGHVAAAALERGLAGRLRHRVGYDGALPMCAPLADRALFDGHAAVLAAALHLAGEPAQAWPPADWPDLERRLHARFFEAFPGRTADGVLTADGERLRAIVTQLSGGVRPGADLAFTLASARGGQTPEVWRAFGGEGALGAALASGIADTRGIVYRVPGDAQASAALNRDVHRYAASSAAEAPRSGGIGVVPPLEGRIDAPMVTLHALGDGYAWFGHQQQYRRRAEAAGQSRRLVQRAVRGVGHCDFTRTEQTDAFDALMGWVLEGRRPEGDEVLDPAVVAAPRYGCRFTRAPTADDPPRVRAARALLPDCAGPGA